MAIHIRDISPQVLSFPCLVSLVGSLHAEDEGKQWQIPGIASALKSFSSNGKFIRPTIFQQLQNQKHNQNISAHLIFHEEAVGFWRFLFRCHANQLLRHSGHIKIFFRTWHLHIINIIKLGHKSSNHIELRVLANMKVSNPSANSANSAYASTLKSKSGRLCEDYVKMITWK